MLNIFEFSNIKEILKSFLDKNKAKLVPASFSYFLEPLWEKHKF